jgi:hypothetical protein
MVVDAIVIYSLPLNLNATHCACTRMVGSQHSVVAACKGGWVAIDLRSTVGLASLAKVGARASEPWDVGKGHAGSLCMRR